MTEAPSRISSGTDAHTAARACFGRGGAAFLLIPAGAAAVAAIARLCIASLPPDVAWLCLHVALIAATVCLAWRVIARHEGDWGRPVRKLHALVDEVRRGSAPIDSLTSINGPVAPLAESVRELLHELRRQKHAVAALEAEIRQRVLHRTDALERVISSLRTQASKDALTGLYNRRMLDEHLPRVFDQCRADGVTLCLMVIDLDNFKLLNDTLGHAAGDELLKSVGQLIRSTIREADLGFRNGGDEFVVVLPACPASAGEQLARRLTSLVEHLVKPLRVPRKPGLSIGIASMSDLKAATPAELIEKADAAMYAQKAVRKASREPTQM